MQAYIYRSKCDIAVVFKNMGQRCTIKGLKYKRIDGDKKDVNGLPCGVDRLCVVNGNGYNAYGESL